MPEINICNSANRDAVVSTESVQSAKKVRWIDGQGKQASSVRVLKAPIEHGIEALQAEAGELSAVAQALVDADPEIDFENTGRILRDTSRADAPRDARNGECLARPDRGTRRHGVHDGRATDTGRRCLASRRSDRTGGSGI